MYPSYRLRNVSGTRRNGGARKTARIRLEWWYGAVFRGFFNSIGFRAGTPGSVADFALRLGADGGFRRRGFDSCNAGPECRQYGSGEASSQGESTCGQDGSQGDRI
jgi:hypothetical protein